MDWGVKVPTYQRLNDVVFSAERLSVETLAADTTPYYSWISEIQNLKIRQTE